ncbi:class II peroxidase, partial [Sphaerobolus stellatus SS14]
MVFKTLAIFASLATLVVAVPSTTTESVTCPDGNIAPNSACCPFFALREDLLDNLCDLFQGVCGEDAHQAVRLIFHDSVAFSQEMQAKGIFSGGGADGSVLVFPDVEANRAENAGIADGVNGQLPFLAAHPVTAADLVQFAAAVG